MGRGFNSFLIAVLAGSRWVMAPLCLGLIVALLILLVQFFCELAHAIAHFPSLDDSEVMLAVLKLVDLVLVANLVLMILGGAVAMFGTAVRTEVAGLADFGSLKLRLLASIIAIAAIDLLETFLKNGPVRTNEALWDVVILIAFSVSGLLLAVMDRLAGERH